MKTIYDDHYINMLMESIEDPVHNRVTTNAQLFNEVSELIGIEPLAKNKTTIHGHDGTITDQYLLYMILKLGERVVELENKLEDMACENIHNQRKQKFMRP